MFLLQKRLIGRTKVENWEEKLLERAREIIKHGKGELTLYAEESKGKTKVLIKAGESWKYIIEKKLDKN